MFGVSRNPYKTWFTLLRTLLLQIPSTTGDRSLRCHHTEGRGEGSVKVTKSDGGKVGSKVTKSDGILSITKISQTTRLTGIKCESDRYFIFHLSFC